MTLEEKRKAFIAGRKPGDMEKLVKILAPEMSRGTVYKYINQPFDGGKHQMVIDTAWKVLK